MKKRFICMLLVIAFLICIPVSAAGNRVTVTDADGYISSNLHGGYLDFTAGIPYEISGDALRTFYYNGSIKYYVFAGGGVTVVADKNAFMDFNLRSALFSLTGGAFEVSYYYNDGSVRVQNEGRLDITYSIPCGDTSDTAAVRFGSGYAVTVSNKNGVIECKTPYLGAFSVCGFEFNDVRNPNSWYYGYVNTAGALGVLGGMGDGNYAPQSPITRAQLAAMIVKATGHIVDYRIADGKAFSDVPSGKWYYECVMQCASVGLVNGVGGGKYAPQSNATREEIATVIERMYGVIGKSASQKYDLKKLYTDSAGIHGYAASGVEFCYEKGFMRGDNGAFRPRDNITRAESAKIFLLVYKDLTI